MAQTLGEHGAMGADLMEDIQMHLSQLHRDHEDQKQALHGQLSGACLFDPCLHLQAVISACSAKPGSGVVQTITRAGTKGLSRQRTS